MALEAREYVAFLGAAAVCFCFVMVAAALSLRAQGRGGEFLPLMVKLILALGGTGAGAYWLGKHIRVELGFAAFRGMPPLRVAVLVAVLAAVLGCIAYAIWSAAKAVAPRQSGTA